MNAAPAAILDASDPCSPLSVPLSKTALLLVDFHHFIAVHQEGGVAAVANARALQQWAKEQNVLTIHGLIDLRASTPASRKMAGKTNGASAKTRLGTTSDAVPDIQAGSGEFIFWRPPSSVSALGSYGIEQFLKQYEIESLILAGFSSSGCIINTAKAAADTGYIVTVVGDASADRNAAVHDVVMSKLLVGQSHVVETEALISAWQRTFDTGADTSDLVTAAAKLLTINS